MRLESAQTLVQLGLHLRGMKGAPPDGRLESKDLFGIPPELLMDPVTRQPFLFVSAGRTNLEPWEILVASPPRPEGRDVLLQDGSVQRFTEARFWDIVTRNRPSSLESLGRYLLGPKLDVADAETAVVQGASIAMSDTSGIHRLNVDLSGAFAQISAGHCEPAVSALHGLLRGLPWDPDREVVFNVARDSKPGADLHEKTQNRHGGLLAILAVLAARTRDGEALNWALDQGRTLWVGGAQGELLLCSRRLDGESDQNWEEVRMRTGDVLRLVPGATPPMTVIRRFKAHGHAPETNRVDLAWPRLP